MTDLGTLGGYNSRAFSINNSGTIIGVADNASQQMQAFIHRNGVLQNLNSLVDLPGVTLTDAVGLNDLGQIVANSGPNGHAYLLTPTNSPGGVQITLNSATALWRIDGGAWQSSGSAILNLAIGNHTIEYGPVTGHTGPATETVIVSSGRLLQLNRTYTPVP
jgi:probable HAF family extracellular repeat protein